MPTPVFTQAGTILTDVRARTKIGAQPTATALQDTAMYRRLSDVNSEYVNEPYNRGVLGWKFLEREQIISSIANTTLNGAVSSGDASIVLTSGTGWDSPSSDVGAGYVKHATQILDFFTFESRSTNTLSTVAGLQMSHPTASEVHKLYRLNGDYGKARALFRESNVIEYQYLDSEFRQAPPYGYYTIKTLYGTNFNGDFLLLPLSVGAVKWKFYYAKNPTSITTSTDRIDAPDGTGRQFVEEKMCSYVWGVLGEYDLANVCEQRADALLNRSLSEWSTPTVQKNTSLQLYW